MAPTPEQTEGPFYIEHQLIRSNIVEDRHGMPLTLRIVIQDQNGANVQGAAVDIWHADASGTYSGFAAMAEREHHGSDGRRGQRGTLGLHGSRGQHEHFGQHGPHEPHGPLGQLGPHRADDKHFDRLPPLPLPMFMPKPAPTDKSTFLRGIQLTDANGLAEFDTIYPGWYEGRAIHIHVKVHTRGTVHAQHYELGRVSHTGQIFFPEEVTELVAALAPYRNTVSQRLKQDDDDIFNHQAGKQCVAAILSADDAPKGKIVAASYITINSNALN